jgi:hypothetical protein
MAVSETAAIDAVMQFAEGTDAQQWARAFLARFAGEMVGPPDGGVDEGLLIAWFANALERGRAAGQAELRPEQPRRARHIRVVREGPSARLEVDGYRFPWVTAGGDAGWTVHVDRRAMPGVTLTIVAERVELDDSIATPGAVR